MTELNISIAIAVLMVVSLIEIIVINRVRRNLRETEEMVAILLKDKMKEEMGEMVQNMKQGLENLFNPKDTKNENKRKTNDKVKHKN